MSEQTITLQGIVPTELNGLRLDQVLSKLFPQYSRAQLQNWIHSGYVTVNGQKETKTRAKMCPDQTIAIAAKLVANEQWQAENIPLNIVYEDNALIVINKPAGLVVHPGAGISKHTLANGLLHYAPELETVPRAGIVHRLDKDTSGLLAIARHLKAHHALTQAIKAREITREYQAIVNGVLIAGGTVDKPIGRHPSHRTHMAIVASGRPAVSHYRVLERFEAHTHIQVQLETGRTHQIRVHMTHINHPLIGDPIYGRKRPPLAKLAQPLKDALQNFNRQALHAAKLGLQHPDDGRPMEWQAPLPEDMENLLSLLRT